MRMFYLFSFNHYQRKRFCCASPHLPGMTFLQTGTTRLKVANFDDSINIFFKLFLLKLCDNQCKPGRMIHAISEVLLAFLDEREGVGFWFTAQRYLRACQFRRSVIMRFGVWGVQSRGSSYWASSRTSAQEAQPTILGPRVEAARVSLSGVCVACSVRYVKGMRAERDSSIVSTIYHELICPPIANLASLSPIPCSLPRILF
jgi:hypothetical protein